MSDAVNSATVHYDVIVIGGGPAGLSAATELKRLGVPRVAVFEREPVAGGIPRHCGHSPFGMREFTRVLSGPEYAKRMVKVALDAGVEVLTSTSVVEAMPGGRLIITSNKGLEEKTARRVVIATGVRETPRAPRMISGTRPLGVVNTGALQSMIYLKNQKPFERPVIVGTELVSFSAIQTCRHAKIRPVAMFEDLIGLLLDGRRRSLPDWLASLFSLKRDCLKSEATNAQAPSWSRITMGLSTLSNVMVSF